MSATIEALKQQLQRHAEKLSRLLKESLIDVNPCEFKGEDDFVKKMIAGIVNYFFYEIRSMGGTTKDLPRSIVEKVLLEMNESKLRQYYRDAKCS